MRWTLAVLCGLIVCAGAASTRAEYNVPLINGLTVRGSVVEISSLSKDAFQQGGAGPQVVTRPVWMIDDGLRRVFVHQQGMVAIQKDGVIPQVRDLQSQLEIHQPVPISGKVIASVGAVQAVTPFNDFGRRQIVIAGPDGSPLAIWQGITEVNARYVKLRALNASQDYLWDSRIATSSIPRDQLRRILHNRMQPLTFQIRTELVRFFIEAEMFDEARLELLATIDAFPEQPNLEKQLTSIVQAQAIQLLNEAKQRRQAGQVKLARRMLSEIALDEFAMVTRLQFKDALAELDQELAKGKQLADQLAQQVDALKPEDALPLRPLVAEIQREISPNTMARLSDYQRLGQDDSLALESRVALALGGWMLGPGSSLQNLALAKSLLQVRERVARYLATTNDADRKAILDQLRQLEGATVEMIAKMLPLLPPALPLPERPEDQPPSVEHPPGMFRVAIEGPEHLASEYLVQLPPEYDPLRAYPVIVSLHPPAGSPRAQIEWWAGGYNETLQMRLGQASRRGFVVVAPAWTRPHQSRYEYTEREHHRVMTCVRDAMRRVSIDADRVFISGHGEGGTAAWDLAVAHPDVWAGLVSIGGEPGKFIIHYGPNAEKLPMYLVLGEMAGSQAPLVRFGFVLDAYMNPRQQAMVVMYRGRGPEDFHEEIHHLFDWMSLQANARSDPPKELDVVTMRGGDRFFWWLEMEAVDERNVVNPFLWDQIKRKPKATAKASVAANNTIRLTQGPADRYTLWLTPSMGVNLNEQILIRFGTRLARYDFDGDIETILEDARRRADRKRPYWAKVQVP